MPSRYSQEHRVPSLPAPRWRQQYLRERNRISAFLTPLPLSYLMLRTSSHECGQEAEGSLPLSRFHSQTHLKQGTLRIWGFQTPTQHHTPKSEVSLREKHTLVPIPNSKLQLRDFVQGERQVIKQRVQKVSPKKLIVLNAEHGEVQE